MLVTLSLSSWMPAASDWQFFQAYDMNPKFKIDIFVLGASFCGPELIENGEDPKIFPVGTSIKLSGASHT